MKLLDYIRGLRKGKEAHRLEKESMQDPFLADAMDGYSQVEGNHEQRIEKLRIQVSTHSAKKKSTYAITWSIAACLVIGFGISCYFLFLKKSMEEEALPLIAQKTDSDSIHTTIKSKTDKKEIKITGRTAQTDNLIKGKVTDEKGQPLIGAAVSYKGTNIGTVTDIDGKFSLIKKKNNKELTASYIGYGSVDVPIDSSQTMLIAMNEDDQQLDEVVIVGHGAPKKMTVTGAISTVSPEALKASQDSLKSSSDTLKNMLTPEPVIGMKQYKKYLKENLVRPTDETCAKAKGKVIVTFLVNREGRPFFIKVKKSLCESSDKEAIRLIQEGPDWTYGSQPVEITVKF